MVSRRTCRERERELRGFSIKGLYKHIVWKSCEDDLRLRDVFADKRNSSRTPYNFITSKKRVSIIFSLGTVHARYMYYAASHPADIVGNTTPTSFKNTPPLTH